MTSFSPLVFSSNQSVPFSLDVLCPTERFFLFLLGFLSPIVYAFFAQRLCLFWIHSVYFYIFGTAKTIAYRKSTPPGFLWSGQVPFFFFWWTLLFAGFIPLHPISAGFCMSVPKLVDSLMWWASPPPDSFRSLS